MRATPKSSWPWVKTLLHSVYDQPDATSVHAQYERILDALTLKLPAVAEHLSLTGHLGPQNVVQDKESGSMVVVVPYDVWDVEGRRFADITFLDSVTATYCPLVRLSIARYQRGTLPGLELSPLVKVDAIPMRPTRALTPAIGPGNNDGRPPLDSHRGSQSSGLSRSKSPQLPPKPSRSRYCRRVRHGPGPSPS